MMDRFTRFSYAISEISRYWHKIAGDEMEKHGLKGPHSVYLLTLYQQRQGVTAAELREICGRDKADVSRSVSLLEEKGFVIREGSSYRAKIRLTEAGLQAAEQVCRRAEKAVKLGGKGLSSEKRQVFYDALDRITMNLRSLSQAGLPEEGAE